VRGPRCTRLTKEPRQIRKLAGAVREETDSRRARKEQKEEKVYSDYSAEERIKTLEEQAVSSEYWPVNVL
jgi:hypothetical protein